MTRIIYKVGFFCVLVCCFLFFILVQYKSPTYINAQLQDGLLVILPTEYQRITNEKRTERISNNVTEKSQHVQNKVSKIEMPPVINSNNARERFLRYRFKAWPNQMTSKDIPRRLQMVRRNYQNINTYRVRYQGKINQQHSAAQIMCQLKNKVNMATLQPSDLPFNAVSLSSDMPKKSLQETLGKLGRCAVVTSSGALKFSRLGQVIDSYDAVLRFNTAPTKGFENDVGSKTTIRLMNSQVVALPSYKFVENFPFKNEILVVWDPKPYSAGLHEWYQRPEYGFFDRYGKYRKKNPNQPFYVLNPQISWQIWDIIQENSPEPIHPNPPSSGSLGILLMMNLCDEVSVYEFLPSFRQNDVCYYFNTLRDQACTYGGYHPLIYEKNLIKKLNQGDENSIRDYGKITLPGLRNLKC